MTDPAKFEADQNVQAGWKMEVCVFCQNSHGAKMLKKPWVVEQTLDCNIGLGSDSPKVLSPANPTYPYVNTATKKVLYNDASDYFTNTNSALCGALTGCTLYAAGCTGSYTPGELTITSAG